MTTSNSEDMVLEVEEENENESNNLNVSSSKRRRISNDTNATEAATCVPQAAEEYGLKASRAGDDDTIANNENNIHNENNDMDNDGHSWVMSPPPFQIDQRVFAKDSNTETAATTGSVSKQPGPETDSTTANDTSTHTATLFPYYPAVIRQARRCVQTGSWTFLVHYSGWNARCDLWISQYAIQPDSAVTREAYQQAKQEQQRQKQIQQQQEALASISSNTPNNGTTISMSARKRRQNGSNASGSKRRTTTPLSSGFHNSKDGIGSTGTCVYEEYCELPFTLKTVLMEEWEKITRTGWDSPLTGYDWPVAKKPARLVHHLPSTVTVSKVVQHFEKKKLQQIQQQAAAAASAVTASSNNNKNATNTNSTAEATTTTAAAITEPSSTASTTTPASSSSSNSPLTSTQIRDFCKGMIQLFQDALPVCLLYPQERPQYEALLLNYKEKQQHANANAKNQVQQQQQESCCQTADVYGCEFLLRLYVRLPVLMQAEITARLNQANSGGATLTATTATTTESSNMDTNNNNGASNSNNNKNDTDNADVAIQLSRDIHYIGPLLSELLVLLQKNRQACFKGNYREAKPEEWLDWERRLYGGSGSGSTATGRGSAPGATATTAAVPAAATTSSTTEGLEMDTQ